MNIATLLNKNTLYLNKPAGAIAKGSLVKWNYTELEQRVETLAYYLVNTLKIKPGDRIALVMQNCIEYIEIMFAAWYTGAIIVPVNSKLHYREIKYILLHSSSSVCFSTSLFTEVFNNIQLSDDSLKKIINTDSQNYKSIFSEINPTEISNRKNNDIAWIFYTSGTTGKPKGAMLTHGNLMAMTKNYLKDIDEVLIGDAIIHAAPMSHGSGLYILPQIANRAIQVIPESGGFNANEICKLFNSYKRITMFGAPTMLRRLIQCPEFSNSNINNIKIFIYGGGPMYVTDLKKAMKVLDNKLVQIYGQGESPMTITYLSRSHHADKIHPLYEKRLASVGIPFTNQRVCIFDKNDKTLQTGKTGEVAVKGPVVMHGYWNDAPATKVALRNGWLHTGDIGELDQDGFLTLKDREKDLIISGGENIYPREIEEILLKHNSVKEASVIGRIDPEWGERVVAFIVLNNRMMVSDEELDILCIKNIARFKRPREYRYINTLPKNNYGKVSKIKLRELIQ